MSGHTPGPWAYRPTNNGHMVAGAKPGYLAEVRDCGSGCVKANARLIAAAPELLEALRVIAGQAEMQNEAYGNPNSPSMALALSEARAAIVKAGAA